MEDWNWETIVTNITCLSSPTVTHLTSKAIEFGEKHKIKAITPFRVIQGHRGVGTNRKPVCDFLLTETDNLSRTAAELSQLTGQTLDIFLFEPPFVGLGTTHDVHLELIGKRVGDFLLVIIEHFSLDFTAKAYIRAKIDRKLAISLQRGHFHPKFQVEGDGFHQSFLHG